MTIEHDRRFDPRIQAAVDDLQELIRSHVLTTTFTIAKAEDPDGVYIRAIVDVDDPDEAEEVVVDRMIDLQVEEGLPIYVLPVRASERRAAMRRKQGAERAIPA